MKYQESFAKDSQDKKLVVLHQLSQEADYITLKELHEKLLGKFPERSIRRWLQEMVKEGLVQKQGSRRGSKYQVIRREERHIERNSSCFSSESMQVLNEVQRPLYEREPVTYQDEWLESYIPNKTFYIPEELRLELFKAGNRSKTKEPAGTYAHQIFNRLLIDLSYNSSRLEGNTYSLLDTERLILEGAGVHGKLDEEKVMILNHKEAIRFLVDNAPKVQITNETVCTLHYLLSDALVEPAYSGKIRDHGVRIGGSTYIPYDNPDKVQRQLTRIFEKVERIRDPYEQSFFILVHLTYIQAFTDVNKRTARLSANIPLIKNNLVPLSFNDVEREDYTSAIISLYEMLNIHPLLDLYLFSYMRTCAMYDATVKSLGFDEIRVRYRQERRMLVREIVLQKIPLKNVQSFISSRSSMIIQENERREFVQDVVEDLQQLDQSRIHGLGITMDQVEEWRKISS